MINERLINSTISTLENTYNRHGIQTDYQALRKRVVDWYNNTEITDTKELAAVALSGPFREGTTIRDIEAIVEEYRYDLY